MKTVTPPRRFSAARVLWREAWHGARFVAFYCQSSAVSARIALASGALWNPAVYCLAVRDSLPRSVSTVVRSTPALALP